MKQTNKIDGVLLLDKDSGISSNRALQQVKHFFNAKKAGHTGSLDPLASGVLPICFGEATKFARFLLEADKTYQVTAKLGVITDSGDADGNIIEQRAVPSISKDELLIHIKKFIGPQLQVPSMFSAIKYHGQPLYSYARKNISVEREARSIFVYNYELHSFDGDEITCEITCSKGTYIRTLIEDLGLTVGCGAHVTSLRRLRAGPFKIEYAKNFSSIQQSNLMELILPIDVMVSGLPRVDLSSDDTRDIIHGKKIVVATQYNGVVSLFSDQNQLIGIGEAQNDGNISALRLVATQGTML